MRSSRFSLGPCAHSPRMHGVLVRDGQPGGRRHRKSLERVPRALAAGHHVAFSKRRSSFASKGRSPRLPPRSRPKPSATWHRFPEHWTAETRAHGQHPLGTGKPYVTYALIAINVAVFLVEIALGGATNIDNANQMGALVIEQGQWTQEYWRLLTATFLHFGVIHIAMNMFALYLIGPFVEFSLGRCPLPRLLSRLGSSQHDVRRGTCPLHTQSDPRRGFGLDHGHDWGDGCMPSALMESGKEQRRVDAAAFHPRESSLFQFLFDLSTPEVSLTAHLGGVMSGFLIALAMRQRLSTLPLSPKRPVG